MEKKWSLSIAVRGLFVSAFFSTIFGVANASAYTVTFDAQGARFSNGTGVNVVNYDGGTVTGGTYELPDLNSPDIYEMYWSTDLEGREQVDIANLTEDTTVYAQYRKVQWKYGYTGDVQSFTVPYQRRILYETWGAQGGRGNDDIAIGGFGGYARGYLTNNFDNVFYIVNGQMGQSGSVTTYNGGGPSTAATAGSGAGATHIALDEGELVTFKDKTDRVVMVAGGGGGANARGAGGNGGGYKGNSGVGSYAGRGGTQTEVGARANGTTSGIRRDPDFGLGGGAENRSGGNEGGGGGAGWYGGSGGGWGVGGAGGAGSGYIGYPGFYLAKMYGVNVSESTTEGEVTISTTEHFEEPTSRAGKEGDGYTLVSINKARIDFRWGDKEDFKMRYWGDTVDASDLDTDRIGYSFDGWFLGDELFDFSEPIEGDITLEGRYSIANYSLTYNLDGGETESANPATYTIESAPITLANPVKDYYTFIGWSGTDLTGDENTSVTIPTGSYGDREYTANYTPIPYAISYDLDGGTNGTNNPTEYNYESNEIVLARPTKEGYTFLGWSGTGIDGEDNLDVTIPTQSHGDREYTAHWSINQYTATFDVNGGTAIDPSTITSDYNVAFGNLPETSCTGYDFDGWYTEQTGGTKIFDTTTMPAEDHTYYAHWTIQTFNISYDLNGGELAQGASNPDTYTYESADINLAKPSREGYTFLGWSGTDLTDNIEDVTIAHNSLGDRSYKAEFQINEYTATFDANAGETANPETITKNYDEEFGNLPETSRLGYSFLGWFTDATAGDEITGATKMPAGNITYYAHWEIITYTIEYDLGGEDMDSAPTNDASNPTSYTVNDSNITLGAATPGDSWHYFVGWALDRDTEDGLTDNFIIDTSETKNIKVYAIFQANPYTVTIDPANGEAETVKSIRGDEEIGELPTPTKDGYDFLGWFCGNKQVDEHFHPRNDARIVAHWEEIPMVPNTGVNSMPNTGDAIMNHIVTFAMCTFALFIVVTLRKHKAKNEA